MMDNNLIYIFILWIINLFFWNVIGMKKSIYHRNALMFILLFLGYFISGRYLNYFMNSYKLSTLVLIIMFIPYVVTVYLACYNDSLLTRIKGSLMRIFRSSQE